MASSPQTKAWWSNPKTLRDALVQACNLPGAGSESSRKGHCDPAQTRDAVLNGAFRRRRIRGIPNTGGFGCRCHGHPLTYPEDVC
jgi:hypothetical protein